MRVSLLHHLNLVFDLAEKTIRVTEMVSILSGDEVVRREPGKRRQCALLSYFWDVPTINELQSLREEFYFADSSITQLDVSFFFVRIEELVLDAHFHVPQLIHGRVV